MARIVGLDYGKKKSGLAVTDPLQIIVSGLETVETPKLLEYCKRYFNEEEVEKMVIGKPTHRDGTDTYLVEDIERFIKEIQKIFPQVEIDFQDENLTSVEAREVIFRSGLKKSKRRDKALIDKVSAILILQRYLGHI